MPSVGACSSTMVLDLVLSVVVGLADMSAAGCFERPVMSTVLADFAWAELVDSVASSHMVGLIGWFKVVGPIL